MDFSNFMKWRAQGVVPVEDMQRVQMSTQEKLPKGRREVRHGGSACKCSPGVMRKMMSETWWRCL